MRKALAISDTIRRVLMVPPAYFTVQYVINPWMKADAVVDKQRAMTQWRELKKAIETKGVEVKTLGQVDGLPDMVFCCNSGLFHDGKVYLSRYRHPERTGEQKYFRDFYRELGLKLLGEDYPEVFEGGGDAFFSDEGTLWAGWGGPRTSKKVYEHIRQLGEHFDIVLCQLVDQRFYHLDTCLCPVGANSALWFPAAFSTDTQKEIRRRLPNAIEVSEEEAQRFVCNAICIRKKVITPRGMTERSKEKLHQLGYTPVEVDMGEFMKSGGACQCLVMKL